MHSFNGMRAVVTGGGSGIGRELVVQLAAEGCSVAACDLNRTTVEETAARATAGAPDGVRITTHVCDVADEASVNRFRDEVVTEHGTDHINLLFNNAGIFGAGSFLTDDRHLWERVFGVCWGGVYNCSRAFMPLLVASEDGYLVNVSSINGFWAKHGTGMPSTAYGTAKFAVKGFSEALIEDLRTNAPHVKVAVVMPGTIITNIGPNSTRVLGAPRADEPSSQRARMASMGLPVQHATEDELQRVVDAFGDVYRECGYMTPAAEAARIILDGLQAGHWRILVGYDAHRIDEAVRSDPENAYEPKGPSLAPQWLFPLIALRGFFDRQVGADISANCELRFGDDHISVQVDKGEMRMSRLLAAAPDATLDTDADTLLAVITGVETLDRATGRGSLKVIGDKEKVERLLAAVTIPSEAQPSEIAGRVINRSGPTV